MSLFQNWRTLRSSFPLSLCAILELMKVLSTGAWLNIGQFVFSRFNNPNLETSFLNTQKYGVTVITYQRTFFIMGMNYLCQLVRCTLTITIYGYEFKMTTKFTKADVKTFEAYHNVFRQSTILVMSLLMKSILRQNTGIRSIQ